MAFTRDFRFKYLARNATTGLTDVTAVVRRNGVEVLGTGTTPLSLVELDSGQYELVLSAAQLNAAGGAGHYDFYVNSATKNAPGIFGIYLDEVTQDDLAAKQIVLEGKIDAIQGGVTAIAADVTSIKGTVEDTNTEVKSPTHGLTEIKNVVDALTTSMGQIQNNTRFTTTFPTEMVIPALGDADTRYRVWIALFDTAGNLEDPDSNTITMSFQDEQGNSRNSYLVGSVAGSTIDAVRDSEGVYYYDIDVPDSAGEEQIISFADYAENTIALRQMRTSNTKAKVNASGLALEASVQNVYIDTQDIKPRVLDIQTQINDATIGLAAIKAAIGAVDTVVNNSNGLLSDGTFGLAALKTLIDGKASQLSVDAIDTKIDDDVKGTGFVQADDSLHEISGRVFFGGSVA